MGLDANVSIIRSYQEKTTLLDPDVAKALNIQRSANNYQILGLNPGANKDAIRKAYRKLAKEWHPDRNKSNVAQKVLQAINEAYENLNKSLNLHRI